MNDPDRQQNSPTVVIVGGSSALGWEAMSVASARGMRVVVVAPQAGDVTADVTVVEAPISDPAAVATAASGVVRRIDHLVLAPSGDPLANKWNDEALRALAAFMTTQIETVSALAEWLAPDATVSLTAPPSLRPPSSLDGWFEAGRQALAADLGSRQVAVLTSFAPRPAVAAWMEQVVDGEVHGLVIPAGAAARSGTSSTSPPGASTASSDHAAPVLDLDLDSGDGDRDDFDRDDADRGVVGSDDDRSNDDVVAELEDRGGEVSGDDRQDPYRGDDLTSGAAVNLVDTTPESRGSADAGWGGEPSTVVTPETANDGWDVGELSDDSAELAVNELRSQRDLLIHDVVELQTRRDGMRADTVREHARFDTLRADVEELTRRQEQLTSQTSTAAKEVDELDRRRGEAASDLESVIRRRDETAARFEQLSRDVSALEQRYEELVAVPAGDGDDLTVAASTAEGDDRETLGAELVVLIAERDRAKMELDELAALAAHGYETVASTHTEIELLEGRRRDLQQQVAALQNDMEQWARQAGETQSRVESGHRAVAGLVQRRDELLTETAAIRRETVELAAALDRIREERQTATVELRRVEQQRMSLQDQLTVLQERIVPLRDELASTLSEVSTAARARDLARHEMERLQETIRRRTDETSRLEAEVAALESRHEGEVRRLDDLVRTCAQRREDALRDTNLARSVLADTLDTLQQRRSDLHDVVEELAGRRSELAELSASCLASSTEVAALNGQATTLRGELDRCRHELETVSAQVADTTAQLFELQESCHQAVNDRNVAVAELVGLHDELTEVRSAIAVDTSRRDALREETDLLAVKLMELSMQRHDLDAAVARGRVELDRVTVDKETAHQEVAAAQARADATIAAGDEQVAARLAAADAEAERTVTEAVTVAQTVRAEAETEAEAIQTRAHEEAMSLLKAAHQRAEEWLKAAREETEQLRAENTRLREDAKSEAAKLVRHAQAAARQTVVGAHEQAKQIVAAAQADAERDRVELLAKVEADYQTQVSSARADVDRIVVAAQHDAERLREQAKKRTDRRLQAVERLAAYRQRCSQEASVKATAATRLFGEQMVADMNQMVDQARDQLAEVHRQAVQDHDRVIAEAQEAANAELARARQEAAELVANASEQAESLVAVAATRRQEVDAEVAAMLERARAQVEKWYGDADRAADAESLRATVEQTAAMLAAAHREASEVRRQAVRESQEIKRLALARHEMVVDALHRECRRLAESPVSGVDVTEVIAEVDRHAASWAALAAQQWSESAVRDSVSSNVSPAGSESWTVTADGGALDGLASSEHLSDDADLAESESSSRRRWRRRGD